MGGEGENGEIEGRIRRKRVRRRERGWGEVGKGVGEDIWMRGKGLG